MPRERRERTTPLMMGQVLGDLDPVDRTTEHYLSQAEQHDRRGWDDVLAPDDDLESRRYRESVDKVPRRVGAVLAFVMLCLCLALGVGFGGFALFAKGKPQLLAPPRASNQPVTEVPAAAPAASKALVIPAAIPAEQHEIVKTAVPPDTEGAERLRQDAIAVRRRRHQRYIEDNFVWSQEQKALVPASSMEQRPPHANVAPGR